VRRRHLGKEGISWGSLVFGLRKGERPTRRGVRGLLGYRAPARGHLAEWGSAHKRKGWEYGILRKVSGSDAVEDKVIPPDLQVN